MRIAFDLSGKGKIWLDDVQLYDQFLTGSERNELQNEVFLAVERMRAGDISYSARLLDSYHGRYLLGCHPRKIANQLLLPNPHHQRTQPPVVSPID